MGIYMIGDTHGRTDVRKVWDWYNKNVDKLTEDDIVIQLGDWGAVWYDKSNIQGWKKDQELQIQWLKKKFTLLVVPGNHSNYNLIDELPVQEKFGGKVKVLKPVNIYSDRDYGEIYILERGEIYNINGKKFLAMGGAMSQDISLRTLNEDYWAQELWSVQEENNALDNLNKHDWEVDYVVAHTCPNEIGIKLLAGHYNTSDYYFLKGKLNDPVSKFFEHLIAEGLKFKEWHFGHWHEDSIHTDSIGQEYQCHYNKVHELIIK